MTNWFTAHLMYDTVGRASQSVPNAWQVNTLHFWLGILDSGAFRVQRSGTRSRCR